MTDTDRADALRAAILDALAATRREATEEAGQVQALLDRDDEIRRLRARAETAEASVAAMRAVLGDSDLAWADRFERLAKEPT